MNTLLKLQTYMGGKKALIFVFDVWLGLACLFPIITALIIMSSMMGKRGRHFLKRYMDDLEEMNTEAVEYVRGISVVKVFQQTVFSFKNFDNSITRYKEMVSEFTMMWETPMSAYTVIIQGFVYVLVPVAILLIGNSGNLAGVLLDLIFFILITPVFAQSIMKNMYMNQALGQATEAVNRIETLTNVDPLPVAPDPISVRGHEISFFGASFTYPGSVQKAIDDISFTLPQDKTYALVGASGSGKTTLARLVPRFWDADTGEVTIGGRDVKEIAPKELMEHVSFVFQNTRLFKTSLLENIRYGNPHATDREIDQAVDLAQCREIIDKLPNGLNTRIGTQGTYLSGGEQQRIALARAILKDAPIVVLDEATAFSEKDLADLTATIMSDNTDLEHTFSHAVPQLFASIISTLLIAVGLLFFNWQLSLALFWVVPVAGVVILLSKTAQRNGHKRIYDNRRNVSECIQEGLETIQEIKAYNHEKEYLNELNQKLNNYEKSLIREELMAGVMVNSAQGVLKLGLASVIIVGARSLSAGSVDLFTYFMFLIVASRIYDPINEVFNNLAALFYLDIRINRMNELGVLPIQSGRTDFKPEHFDIVFDQVNFSYEDGKQVMNNVSFKARQGEITALVGPSGGRKSTSAKLAARFWNVDSGKILLGSQNINEIEPETLLQNYSVVFQDVVLFNTTIMDNIRIGRRNATDAEVMHVAKLAQCDAFVRKMPNGYQTVIGENGQTLSGGERQRISIARALLKDAPIVLLDEATASLDVENETKIQAGISELIKNKTALIIAHRMRTVANADKIVVLENGKVIESGKPDALKQQNGVFAKMVERQMLAV